MVEEKANKVIDLEEWKTKKFEEKKQQMREDVKKLFASYFESGEIDEYPFALKGLDKEISRIFEDSKTTEEREVALSNLSFTTKESLKQDLWLEAKAQGQVAKISDKNKAAEVKEEWKQKTIQEIMLKLGEITGFCRIRIYDDEA